MHPPLLPSCSIAIKCAAVLATANGDDQARKSLRRDLMGFFLHIEIDELERG